MAGSGRGRGPVCAGAVRGVPGRVGGFLRAPGEAARSDAAPSRERLRRSGAGRAAARQGADDSKGRGAGAVEEAAGQERRAGSSGPGSCAWSNAWTMAGVATRAAVTGATGGVPGC